VRGTGGKRKTKKGRAIRGMTIGVRVGIEVINEEDGKVIEGIMRKLIKIGEERWRIVAKEKVGRDQGMGGG